MVGKDYDGEARLDMKHVKWINPPPYDREAGAKAPAASLLPGITSVRDFAPLS